MSEHLKKEFTNDSELQRMRNIIQKKFGERTKVQKGYEKQYLERKEGEIWEEGGKYWTIKNSIKVSYSPTEVIRDMIKIPLWCPTCNGNINSNYDKKMFKIYGHCFSCQLKIETNMKIEGTFEKFEEESIKSNLKTIIKNVEEEIEDYLKDTNQSTILTSEGHVEDWTGKEDKENIVKDIKELTEQFKEKFEIE